MEKILVIEDNKLLRENISEILSSEGYEVSSAENGQVGLEKLEEFLPDLIVSDVNMPVMDGFEVLEHLRLDEKVNTIPFIFLTVKNTMHELRFGMNLGADDYLTKPFDMKELLEVVRMHLNKKKKIVAKEEEKYDKLKNSIGFPITSVIDDPLRNIERLADLVTGQLDNLSGPDIGEITRLISSDASKLRKDLNKVLYFYRIEALKSNVDSLQSLKEQTTFEARSIISTVVTDSVEDARRKSDLALDIEEASLKIPKEFLEYALKELVSNACHFSTKGSSIKVTGREFGKTYRLTIQDNGIGFGHGQSLNDIAPYIRLSGQQRKSDGLGLGLYNVKTIIELFNGQIDLDSELGIGTTITIVLSHIG